MNRNRGFTLIELMITVAIIALVASFAIPSYQDQVRKGRRVDGEALLLDAAQKLERYYTDNNTYTTNMSDLYGGSSYYKFSEEGNYLAIIGAGGSCAISNCFWVLGFPMNANQIKDGYPVIWSNGRRQKFVAGTSGWREGWQ